MFVLKCKQGIFTYFQFEKASLKLIILKVAEVFKKDEWMSEQTDEGDPDHDVSSGKTSF